MKIIKKDGRLQEFDKRKLFTSLDNASGDVKGVSLNQSDINILVQDICNKLSSIRENGTPSSSYEIVGVMMKVLKNNGFSPVIKSFLEHE